MSTFFDAIGPAPNTLVTEPGGKLVHRDLLPAWMKLHAAAAAAGFDLAIASGFRDAERQQLIWNTKVRGERPVLDSSGAPLDLALLSPWQQAQAILRWSALPGASRHHWGSDLDVYDRAAVPEDYCVQLSRQEVESGGPFAPLHDWLDDYLASHADEGFFRPYCRDFGGIAPERWHLSYAPLAAEYQCQTTLSLLQAYWQSSDLLLRETVIEHSREIYRRFVWVSADLYPQPWRARIASATPPWVDSE